VTLRVATARWGRAVVGPALIMLATLAVLHSFWLGPRLTNQHPDLLAFWLPRWCYLGKSIAGGHIPTWLSHQAAGVPFASDPQSGWLYAPPTLLFSILPCGRAIGLMVVFNPLLAGLGMYLFLRMEGLRRPAATVGGLTLSLAIAGSVVVLSMPFAATLGWATVVLAGTSGYLGSSNASRAVAWLALAVFGLSQVAAAHLTSGLLVTLIAEGMYVAARSFARVKAKERGAGRAVLLALGPFLTFPILAAGVLVPRLALLPRTSIGHGYVELSRIGAELSAVATKPPLAVHGANPWSGTAFARSPGGYVGALAIVLFPVALASKRWRAPSLAFAAAGFAGWLLDLDWMIRTGWVRAAALKIRLGELWLRDPERFVYLLPLAFAALAGYGVQAWLDLARVNTLRAGVLRLSWLLPGIALFALAPLAWGSAVAPYALFGLGLAAACPLLFLAARGREWAALALPILVAVELLSAGLASQGHSHGSYSSGGEPANPDKRFGHAFSRLAEPRIARASYLTAGPIGQTIAEANDFGRYLSFDPAISSDLRAWLTHQTSNSWPAYENGRSILFGIDEIQGYLPVQIDRYWRLVRSVDPDPIFYNEAAFQVVRPEILRLFGVEWLVVPTNYSPPVIGTASATEGRFTLYRLADAEPRASVVFQWTRVQGGGGLDDVLEAGFDPAIRAIVERDPDVDGSVLIPDPAAAGTASYEELAAEHVRIRVTASAPGLLVVRNVFDRNWHATVDGKPVPILIADYLMQGVAVPAGSHVVELTYRDSAIGVGLAVSGAAWVGLSAVLALLIIRRRRASAKARERPT
jgi:hypothetical protein